jgi:hypothetical protein
MVSVVTRPTRKALALLALPRQLLSLIGALVHALAVTDLGTSRPDRGVVMFGSWSKRRRAPRTLCSRAISLATAAGLTLLVSPAMTVLTAAPARAATGDPSGVSFTLEGCRNDGTITLPNGSGKFICPTSAYTTGNLGKGWNELDLVPHRLTTSAGNSATGAQYIVAIAADNCIKSGSVTGYTCANGSDGYPGYDVLSVPVLNTSLSTNSGADCSLDAVTDPATVLDPGVGGTDVSLGRKLTITQPKNTTCVFDYYERLALGSHLFPGSSLHSDLLNQSYTTSGIGAKDVSLPVKEIQPQSISKDMSAAANGAYSWSVEKHPSTATMTFANTCDQTAGALSESLTVQVIYTRNNPSTSDYTVTTHVYATNPSSRTITVGGPVSTNNDKIYSGTHVLTTTDIPATDVPANTANALILTDTQAITNAQITTAGGDPAHPGFNDIATVTYTDKVTQVTVPGTTTANASVADSAISTGTNANSSADLSDVTSISGSNLKYSIDSVDVSGGTFKFDGTTNAYTLGAHTADAVKWLLTGQSASVTVNFGETVYVDAAATTTGTLSDTAKVMNGTTQLASTTASVDLSGSPLVSLTVSKTIPLVLDSNDTNETFTFDVTGAGGYTSAPTNPSVTFNAPGDGGSAKTTTLTGLTPDTFTVAEETPGYGYNTQSDQTHAITPNPAVGFSSCSYTFPFANTFTQGKASVQKVTDPAGNEAGWTFTLTGPGLPAAGVDATTTGAGAITFQNGGTDFQLQEGTYTVTEAANGPYDNTAILLYRNTTQVGSNQINDRTPPSCQFTVNYPADAQAMYKCQFTNTKKAEIIVNKATVPSSDTTTSFPFSETGPNSYSNPFSLKNGGSDDTGMTLTPGTGYGVAEGTLPSGWSQTSASCTRNGDTESPFSPGSFDLSAGDVVTCDFVNTHRVALTITKAINANGDNLPADGFVFSVSCSDGTTGTVTFHSAGSQSVDGIVEGSTCDVTETPVAGWTSSPSGTQHVTVGPDGATVSFTNTRDTGVITVTKATSGAVAGASTVFNFDIVCPISTFNQTLTIDTSSASSATSSAIPTGMVCSVVEEGTSGWQQTVPVQGGIDVTVPGTAAFTNTRLTGPLQLIKSVTPSTGSYTVGDPSNTLNYTLSLSPTGALDHTGVVVTDYIPGYDPSDTKSGKTTYVAGSAGCSTGCSASYDAAQHLLTWTVGNVAHNAAAILLTFKVTIDRPAFNTTVGLPSETIDNIGFVQSVQQGKTPSNQVKTPVTAVLGVKVVRPPVLAFTGLPAQTMTMLGLLMLGAGIVLTSVRRKEQ